jgi:hypothetical protein
MQWVNALLVTWEWRCRAAGRRSSKKQSLPQTAAVLAAGVLLGFNEPDYEPEEILITPERALQEWPRFMATGMRLGSPSAYFVTNGSAPYSWMEQFMRGVDARGLRVDFMTFHWLSAERLPCHAHRAQAHDRGRRVSALLWPCAWPTDMSSLF